MSNDFFTLKMYIYVGKISDILNIKDDDRREEREIKLIYFLKFFIH